MTPEIAAMMLGLRLPASVSQIDNAYSIRCQEINASQASGRLGAEAAQQQYADLARARAVLQRTGLAVSTATVDEYLMEQTPLVSAIHMGRVMVIGLLGVALAIFVLQYLYLPPVTSKVVVQRLAVQNQAERPTYFVALEVRDGNQTMFEIPAPLYTRLRDGASVQATYRVANRAIVALPTYQLQSIEGLPLSFGVWPELAMTLAIYALAAASVWLVGGWLIRRVQPMPLYPKPVSVVRR